MGKKKEIPSSQKTLLFSSHLPVEFLSFVEIWPCVEHTATHCNNLQHTLQQPATHTATNNKLPLLKNLFSFPFFL